MIDNAELVARLVSLFADERAAVAGELHDGLMQNVVGARMWLNSFNTATTAASREAVAALEVIQHALDSAAQDARNVINELSLIRDATSRHELCIERIIDFWVRRGLQVEYHAAADELNEALAPLLALNLAWLLKYADVDARAETVRLRISGGCPLRVEVELRRPVTATAASPASPRRLGFVKRLVELWGGQFEVNAHASGETVMLLLPHQTDAADVPKPIMKSDT